jgi:hypothetical protein
MRMEGHPVGRLNGSAYERLPFSYVSLIHFLHKELILYTIDNEEYGIKE